MAGIDLGLGVTAELDGDEIKLIDDMTDDPITLSLDQFDRLAEFIAIYRSKP